MRRPLLGQGLGTRQTGVDNPLRNAPILDNQWLGTFLDIGLLGVAGWLWLIVRIVRRLGRVARTRGSPDGLLAAGFVASITGFAVAMLTYDSLAFVQETFVFWVLLALAAMLIAVHPETEASSPEAGDLTCTAAHALGARGRRADNGNASDLDSDVGLGALLDGRGVLRGCRPDRNSRLVSKRTVYASAVGTE